MTATEETEPLIPVNPTVSKNRKTKTYRAIPLDERTEGGRRCHFQGSPETSLRMGPLFDASSESSSLLNEENYGDRITYTWSNVNVYTVAKTDKLWQRFFRKRKRLVEQKHILQDVHGVAYPGELLAIMGSSGAGKTTLLNALTFRSKTGTTVSGVMAANGRRVSLNVLASRMAYVQQHDLFLGTLTVKEHLLFQAMLRMDRHIPYSIRAKRVNEVLAELGLTKCKNTIIGKAGAVKGLSGGEMKRLSFASEILTDPPLMFCDEPTSGLDSFMAHQVISVLKTLAARGKTIVITLHQPSSELFALFDKILLMAEGRVAFMGTISEACGFFKTLGGACPTNYNPANYFIETLAVIPGQESLSRQTIYTVCESFAKSELAMKIVLEAENDLETSSASERSNGKRSSPYKATWCEQFRAVSWRSWLLVQKEVTLVKVRFSQTIMVALLIGIIFYGQKLNQDGAMNINGALYFFLTNSTFQNLFAVINVFCAELPIFLREHQNGMYRTDVYFICKNLAELPIFVAAPAIFVAIAYPMIGLNPGVNHFFSAVCILILVANVAISFGYLVSCASTGTSMALSIGPPLLVPLLLFGGFFLNTGSIPVYLEWISYLSWFRYANEALLINQWSDVEFIECTRSNITCPKNGHMILQTFSFKEDRYWIDILCLFALILVFRFCALLALMSKTRRSD